jgi:hypothetical protein
VTTDNGVTELSGIVNDPDAPFTIEARTDNGEISIGEAP